MMLVSGLIARHQRAKSSSRASACTGPYTNLGIVFQRDALLEWRTVLDNVLLQADIRRLDRAQATRRRPWICSRAPASRASRTIIPGSCPAACASASRICRALVTIRRCC